MFNKLKEELKEDIEKQLNGFQENTDKKKSREDTETQLCLNELKDFNKL
jgi:hypothetical protein